MGEKIAVVGLGYVGLPLALAFGRVMPTIGYDISEEKIRAYREGYDPTGEMESELFQKAQYLGYTTNPEGIGEADYIIVAVPTPIDRAKMPDLEPVEAASRIIGRHMKKGATVIFESTVYPGVTEDICVPILERESGMKCGEDFKVGYSPERVNPGDKVHTLEKIVKVVSGQDEETLDRVAKLYERVIEAGVHRAPTIKVAEAAKVIENTQRDLNIALINELAIIFDYLGIDTIDVLEAAGTKWNFLPFRPGLVGGHCIGVDPYYLTYKASLMGYQPDVILSGRQINDGMGKFVVDKAVKLMIDNDCKVKGSKVAVLGITFKENCADLRNTRVVDIVEGLEDYGVEVLVYDPEASPSEAREEYGINLVSWEALKGADAVIAAVAHDAIKQADVSDLLTREGMPFLDVKAMFDRDRLAEMGFNVWRL